MEKSVIENFIAKFHGTEDAFLNGCCFWFAKILSIRFPGGQIVYDFLTGHFLYRYCGALWDVTGEAPREGLHEDCSGLIFWDGYEEIDPVHYSRILRQCVLFDEMG